MTDSTIPQDIDFSYWQLIEEAWDIYLSTLTQAADLCPSPADRAMEYERRGYQQGCISPDLTQQLLCSLSQAKRIPFDPDATDPQWLSSVHSAEAVQSLMTNHEYYVLTARELWLIWQALEEMRDPVAEALGQAWRVLSVRGWESTAQCTPSGPTDWHVDSLPRLVAKIMLYLTPLTPEYGGLELQWADAQQVVCSGNAGTWILFKNSQLVHRGLAPLKPDCVRKAIEITIALGLSFQLRPTYRGLNTRQPLIPWPTQRFIPFS